MNSSVAQFGSLRCRVIDALASEQSPRCIVVLNHGFGAPGDDLVDFGPALIDSSALIESGCRFVFPEAPIDLSRMGMPGSRAWWPINMALLAQMQETQDFEQLTAVEPPGMVKAAELLLSALSEMKSAWSFSDSRLVLGGFSQGAMVSTHAVLSGSLRPALLALFSGTLLWRDEWKQLIAAHPGTDVLQSHGTQDQILPFAAAIQLRDLLRGSRFSVDFVEFNGPHTIPTQVFTRLQQKLEELLLSKSQ